MTCSSEEKSHWSCIMVWGTIIKAMTRCKLCNCRQLVKYTPSHVLFKTALFWRLFVRWKNFVAMPMWHEVKFLCVLVSNLYIYCSLSPLWYLELSFCVIEYSIGIFFVLMPAHFLEEENLCYAHLYRIFSAPNFEYFRIRSGEMLISIGF